MSVEARNSFSWVPLLTTAVSVGATIVALNALNNDYVNRRIFGPDWLQRRRHTEYRYRWSRALAKAKASLRHNFSRINRAEGVLPIEVKLLDSDEQINALIKLILSDRDKITLRVGEMGIDPKVKKNSSNSNELFVWLYSGPTTIYQVSLRQFGTLFADAFDKKITNNTFCFISEASSGVASRWIVDLVRATESNTVAIIENPLWLVFLAVIAEQQLVDAALLERVLFALCRLEALAAVSAASKEANGGTRISEITTILVSLPGQSTTSTLLPLLQKVFPDDRHVFAYSGLIKSLQYANHVRQVGMREKKDALSFSDALEFTDANLMHSTPMQFSLQKSANVMNRLNEALAQLPMEWADTAEAWMTAVDAFLNLKEDEKINGYLPYVLSLDYILKKAPFEKEKSDRYWSLLSLLQYIMGARTRGIPTKHMDAAIGLLLNNDEQSNSNVSLCFSKEERKAIQNVVFQHKMILIENITLKDTVQPRQHWTLKAAAKAGCSCCGPEEEDEEAEDMGALAGKLLNFAMETRSMETPNGNASGYVDGKATFAFDPSRFTGMGM